MRGRRVGDLGQPRHGEVAALLEAGLPIPGGDHHLAQTGAQDAAIASLTGEAQLINHGDWTVSESAALTAMPGADGYLYMACGAATDADYTAGKFLIELWGV